MLPLHTRFRMNEAEVAAEVFDGEAIILNLATGAYYSLDRAGGFIWSMIADGHSLEETTAILLARYEVSPEQARADVERVTADLVQEHLVLVAEDVRPARSLPEADTPERLPYDAPALNVYRDMGAMLALDPPMPRLDEIPWKESDDGPPR